MSRLLENSDSVIALGVNAYGESKLIFCTFRAGQLHQYRYEFDSVPRLNTYNNKTGAERLATLYLANRNIIRTTPATPFSLASHDFGLTASFANRELREDVLICANQLNNIASEPVKQMFLDFLQQLSEDRNKQSWKFRCESLITTMNYTRVSLNDSVFVDEFLYGDTSQNHFDESNLDTFLIRGNDLFYKRNQFFFQYFSEESFARGDTIRIWSKSPIERTGRFFWLDEYYIPNGKKIYDGEQVLVYKWMGHWDSPAYSFSEIYFSPLKRQVVYMYSLGLGQCILQ